jgi:hypothetical protein
LIAGDESAPLAGQIALGIDVALLPCLGVKGVCMALAGEINEAVSVAVLE